DDSFVVDDAARLRRDAPVRGGRRRVTGNRACYELADAVAGRRGLTKLRWIYWHMIGGLAWHAVMPSSWSSNSRTGTGRHMSDEHDNAESVDEDMLGTDPVAGDEVGAFDDAPDRPVGLPFADADVTDESFAERSDRAEPE